MRMRDALPGKYLAGDDLDSPVTVTIDRVVLESFRDPRTRVETQKPVMYFHKAKRGLIVNRTNWRAIADQYGDESDNWPGKRIVLAPMMVDAYGKRTRAIRVRKAAPTNDSEGGGPVAFGPGKLMESEVSAASPGPAQAIAS